MTWLEGRNIETRMLFAGDITKQPAYKECNFRISGDLENTTTVMHNTFFIGVFPGITGEARDYIIESVRGFLDGR